MCQSWIWSRLLLGGGTAITADTVVLSSSSRTESPVVAIATTTTTENSTSSSSVTTTAIASTSTTTPRTAVGLTVGMSTATVIGPRSRSVTTTASTGGGPVMTSSTTSHQCRLETVLTTPAEAGMVCTGLPVCFRIVPQPGCQRCGNRYLVVLNTGQFSKNKPKHASLGRFPNQVRLSQTLDLGVPLLSSCDTMPYSRDTLGPVHTHLLTPFSSAGVHETCHSMQNLLDKTLSQGEYSLLSALRHKYGRMSTLIPLRWTIMFTNLAWSPHSVNGATILYCSSQSKNVSPS